MERIKVYLSLGGNEGQVLLRLQRALQLLAGQPDIVSLENSHFYQTAPWQVNSLSWFINAVCTFQTSLSPREIFRITQTIEIQLGKVAKPKNADRPIDIDILFYGDQVYDDNELKIPHPCWKERLFVLVPLADLTQKIFLHQPTGSKYYALPALMEPLLSNSSQVIYLLEKNPHLQ